MRNGGGKGDRGVFVHLDEHLSVASKSGFFLSSMCITKPNLHLFGPGARRFGAKTTGPGSVEIEIWRSWGYRHSCNCCIGI